ncbi:MULTISPECIES: transporter substrate-binding domain-containing protein [unclassified Rhizobium]|uniref:transporter substrate-binding domain-containing protein n=1 Tax=unclassified Rhizobium TaxID=2613769 RepID=UPI000714A60F|nr:MULTISPECIES: transporter substrate-binding domain-containing protein [unclassified Rhizobium]KQT04746.1 amino acid ABC transporter substrate-binding protein [Rhizobium sp. Leaf386]KQT05113.1 amino acid ABC transporter substrate-binding protein [Rhizobium sp. Leaf391]KQU02098.1 amino acid ABC transporter substrate-binding protein [Rhizobium sp. Leaf453]
MRHLTRLTALAASLAFTLSALPANAGAVLDRVLAAKTLKVATDANWAPQSFMNDKNELDGFDVDVAKDIGKRLGVSVEFVTPGWDIITAGNWSGRWDMHVGSMTPTKARAEIFDFPGIYYYTPAAVAVHKDSKATTLADLNDKTIGTTATSTFEAYAKQELTLDAAGAPAFKYEFKPKEVKSYSNSTTAFDDLRLGDGTRLDAVVSSLPSIKDAEKAGYPIEQLGEPVFYEPLAVATEHGDAEFDAKISEAVKGMQSDGTLSKLSVKWYGVDYTVVK